MRIHTSHAAIFALGALFLAVPAFAEPELPPNLNVAPVYRELVESMADQSPTFLGQMLRIGSATTATVHLDVVPHIIGARAQTRIERRADGLTAWIEVTRFDDIVELIAHEIEHVIEQLEGVNLAAGAVLADTGIRAVNASGTMFETARAARAGVAVAQEVREAAKRKNADALLSSSRANA